MSISVMVIDDEWPALDHMKELLLQCEGISSVLTYDNPREALTAASELKPDVLFLDIQMPELSGLTFAEKLLPFSPDTDIVFVTAYRNYAVEAFDLSAMDYLLKPVDPSRLRKTWNKLLSKRLSPEAAGATAATGKATSFRLLGDYELISPLGLVKWRTHKAQELFAYLWIHRQGSVSLILNDVFPQWNYEKGKQYLHTTVYQIRTTLKKAALEDKIELTFGRENYRLESGELRETLRNSRKLPPLRCKLAGLRTCSRPPSCTPVTCSSRWTASGYIPPVTNTAACTSSCWSSLLWD